jgi:hypothetical protein
VIIFVLFITLTPTGRHFQGCSGLIIERNGIEQQLIQALTTIKKSSKCIFDRISIIVHQKMEYFIQLSNQHTGSEWQVTVFLILIASDIQFVSSFWNFNGIESIVIEDDYYYYKRKEHLKRTINGKEQEAEKMLQ